VAINKNLKIFVVGANGMIGSAIMRVLCEKREWDVFGSIRNGYARHFFQPEIRERLIDDIDVEIQDKLAFTLNKLRPDVVINCAGLTKHKVKVEDPFAFIPINTLMPHKLAYLCKLVDARLIHISTDCVFSGAKGQYVEDDFAEASDAYGKSKSLGEVRYPNTITLRTSTIGHELQGAFGLLDWFLSQEVQCKGFTRAIFSGLPTIVFGQLIRDIVIPHPELSGIYNIAAKPISKFDLLKLIASVYGKEIDIVQDNQLAIDRSLDASKFKLATGYSAPEWPELIKLMHSYK